MIYLILQESAINEKMVILNTGKKKSERSRDKVDAAGRKRNKAACGFHAALSSMPR